MQAVKQALRATALADDTLIELLGGQFFYYRRPQIIQFQNGEKAIISFIELTSARDKEVPRYDESYPIDIWSRSSDLNDAIAERLVAIFDPDPVPIGWAAMTITGYRLDTLTFDGATEIDDPDPEIHHKVIQIRVIAIPT